MTTFPTLRLGGLLLAAMLPMAALADDMTPGAMTHGDTPGAVTHGDLILSGAFARATLPGAPVAGGFVTIENTGAADMRLIAGASPAAERVEIHEMAMDGDVMRMRELPDGLPIPAGETVVLKPGGYHLMMMQLTGPLVEGETVPVTLEFEGDDAPVTITLTIGAPNARSSHGDH